MTDQPACYDTDEQRWHAVIARDAGANAHFVYAVRTTGLYCLPGAAGKRPRRENVTFFPTPAAAEAAGYRPSQRVQALDQTSARHAAIIRQACLQIETAETAPGLHVLAQQAGMSSYHFHRVFKAETGVTPKAYAQAARVRRLRSALSGDTASVTAAIYDAGFNSNSRFYENATQVLGMPARSYRAGGAGALIRFAIGQCSLGAILVAQSQQGICAILLGDSPEALLRDLQDQFPKAELLGGDPAFEQQVAQIVGFVETPARGLNLPLDVRGTAFQQRVWQALREIPPGATASYTDIATRICAPKAVRAVAQACAANKLAVAIPCHRVVRQDGDISGYRWGVARKRELLRREHVDSTAAAPDIAPTKPRQKPGKTPT